MEQIRAFIAVELPPAVREAVEGVVRELRSGIGDGVRWVRPEGVHLTLKFLGDIDAGSVPAVSRAMAQCAASAAPFDLFLEGVGVFPNARRPRVIWIGLGGALEPLLALQHSIDRELEGLGFARERRPFTPHLTLGRVRDGSTRFAGQGCVGSRSRNDRRTQGGAVGQGSLAYAERPQAVRGRLHKAVRRGVRGWEVGGGIPSPYQVRGRLTRERQCHAVDFNFGRSIMRLPPPCPCRRASRGGGGYGHSCGSRNPRDP